MQVLGRTVAQRYNRAAYPRHCHVRCAAKDSAGGRAQRPRQRRSELGVSHDTRNASHVHGDEELPHLNSMQLRRSQSGAQAARLADNLIQAPLEPRGVVANLLDKLRVCTSLAKGTYAHLGKGWLWLACFVRLMLFSAILAPGFFMLTIFYFFSNRVHRNLWYGQKPRNLLDVYVPYRHWFNNGPVPVVIFITGGAYIIGYKAWGALLAKRLSQAGVLVVCLDYRNFPQGIITDMMEDCQAGIGWVLKNIQGFGGDTSRVYVMGQSCGGHLAALTLQKQYELWGTGEIKAANRRGLSASAWNPDSIKGFLALSSLFNMSTMQPQFERRGMSKGMVLAIFGQSTQQSKPVNFAQYSPYQHFSEEIPRKKLPRTLLMHGTADATVPSSESEGFKQALMKHGIDVQLKMYEGATHTSKLLEDPMRGGKDDVVGDVLEFMKLDTTEHTHFWPMLPFPKLTSAVASFVCPF